MEDHIKHKLRNHYHRVKLHVQTNAPTQISLLVLGALIVITIILGLVISTLSQEKEFLKYNIKKCYDKRDTALNRENEISYSTKNNMVSLSYVFEQKCFKKSDISYTIDKNSISLVVTTKDSREDCSCDTDVEVTLGPLEDNEYTFNIIKKADKLQYLVDSRNVTVS